MEWGRHPSSTELATMAESATSKQQQEEDGTGSKQERHSRTHDNEIVNNIIYFGAGATQLSKQTSTNTYITQDKVKYKERKRFRRGLKINRRTAAVAKQKMGK
jgi:hypothetical protein